MEDVQGGNAIFNAEAIRSVLNGERGARRDIGLLNAAAALMVAGRVADLAGGLVQAAQSIDSGRAAGGTGRPGGHRSRHWPKNGAEQQD